MWRPHLVILVGVSNATPPQLNCIDGVSNNVLARLGLGIATLLPSGGWAPSPTTTMG